MTVGSRINPNFPIPGIDQSSRGFRDNFGITKQEIENLQGKRIQLSGSLISSPVQIGNGNADVVIPVTVDLSAVPAAPPAHSLQYNNGGHLGGSNVFYNSGNVGVNTSTPNHPLDIIGSTGVTGNIYISNSTTASGIVFSDGSFQTTAKSNMVTAKDFGAVGDGITDDTIALQNAINTNQFVELLPDKIYLVSNLTFGSVATSSGSPQSGLIVRSGTATIKKKSGGSANYLIATPNWIANNAYADQPIMCIGVTFDGSGIAQDVVVNQSFFSQWQQCTFINGTRHGHRIASSTANSSGPVATTGNRFIACNASTNGGDGLHIDPYSTDSQISNGFFFSNGNYGVYLGTAAGTQISQIHTYSNTLGGFWADQYGYSTSIVASDFEDGGVVNSLASQSTGLFGPGNSVSSRLAVNFADNIAYEIFRSFGNTYQSGGYLYQGYNGIEHTIYSDGDNFYGNPFVWVAGSVSLGRIIAKDCYALGAGYGNQGTALINGIQYPSNVNLAPNIIAMTKYLSNSSTTDTFTVTTTVPAGNPNSGFIARGYINVWSLDSTQTLVDTYTSDFRIQYMRVYNTTTSINSAVLFNSYSANSHISSTIATTDVTHSGSDNTVTTVITITHPQAPDQYSSSASIHFESENRNVTSILIS